MNTNTVYLLVVTSTFFWGSNFVLAGPILADLPPLWAAAVRFVLGAALMIGLAACAGKTCLDCCAKMPRPTCCWVRWALRRSICFSSLRCNRPARTTPR